MLGAILGLMAYAAIFWSVIPCENIKVRAVIALMAAVICILMYKIPLLGYLMKICPGPVIMHKWIVPISIYYGSQYAPEYADKMELIGKLLFLAGSCMYALFSLLFTSWGFFKTGRLFNRHRDRDTRENKSAKRKKATESDTDIKPNVKKISSVTTKLLKSIKEFFAKIISSLKRITRHSKPKKKQSAKRKKSNASVKKNKTYTNNNNIVNDNNFNTDSDGFINNNDTNKVYRKNSGKENSEIFFFRGCNDMESCIRRYNMLMREYHPNKENGDDIICNKINEEYEAIRRKYASESKSQTDKRECS